MVELTVFSQLNYIPRTALRESGNDGQRIDFRDSFRVGLLAPRNCRLPHESARLHVPAASRFGVVADQSPKYSHGGTASRLAVRIRRRIADHSERHHQECAADCARGTLCPPAATSAMRSRAVARSEPFGRLRCGSRLLVDEMRWSWRSGAAITGWSGPYF